jgi:hypothetical protein
MWTDVCPVPVNETFHDVISFTYPALAVQCVDVIRQIYVSFH